MKRLFLILLLTTAALFGDMYWADDYKSGVKDAKKEDKNIILLFSKEDCEKCDDVLWTISFDKNVSNYVAENFIAIEIDVEYDRRQGFKVYKTPTVYFLDSKAKQIGKPLIKSLDPQQFLKRLEKIVEQTN